MMSSRHLFMVAAACVCGFANAATNVATLGTASQSSLYGANVASRAIDGNTDGNYYNGSVQHTNADSSGPRGNGFAWWEVALDQDYQIDSITVWNRTDCCTERLRSFSVSVFDDGSLVWIGSFLQAGGPAPSFSFNALGVTGDTVFVQLDRQDYLHMAEVQVFATPVPEPGSYAMLLAGLGLVGALARRRAP